jgi:ParB-like chromosome segregation protein Spo0J
MPKAEKKRAGARGSNGVAGAPSLTVVMVPVGDLNPAPYNPRKMTEKQAADLTASIRKFGMQEPLVVNRAPGRENVVIGGHQRLNVCKLLGHTAVPVVYVELAEPEERELNLRLNKNTGEWDWDLLAEFDVPLLRDVGFTDEELAKNFDLDGGETPTDADVLPEKVEARTKLGDVWVLGGHRLVCGDSVKDDAAVRLALDGALADCVWTDPPYGVSYEGKAGTVANDSLSDEEHEAFITNALTHALTHAREGAAAYVTHASSQTILTWRAFGNAGGRFSQPLVWAKDRIVLGRSDYHFAHEPILYGWKPGASLVRRAR